MPDLSPARAADASAIAELAAASLPEPWSLVAWEAELSRDDAHVWVARAARGALAGFASARFTADAGHLLALAVTTDARGRGVGGALLSRLVGEAEAVGLGALEVETRADDARARDFYLRRGFVAVGRRPRYYGGGKDALLLTRHLAPGRVGHAGVTPP